MPFRITYDDDGIELSDLEGYNLQNAYDIAKKVSKREGWKIVSVRQEEPLPAPIMNNSCQCRHREFADYTVR